MQKVVATCYKGDLPNWPKLRRRGGGVPALSGPLTYPCWTKPILIFFSLFPRRSHQGLLQADRGGNEAGTGPHSAGKEKRRETGLFGMSRSRTVPFGTAENNFGYLSPVYLALLGGIAAAPTIHFMKEFLERNRTIFPPYKTRQH
jgi:hypothetical protein